MKMTKSYAGLTPQQGYDKGIQDIVDYLGVAKFREVCKAFQTDFPCGCHYRVFAFYASMLGVQGFPVHAWYDFVFPIGDAPSHEYDWPRDC